MKETDSQEASEVNQKVDSGDKVMRIRMSDLWSLWLVITSEPCWATKSSDIPEYEGELKLRRNGTDLNVTWIVFVRVPTVDNQYLFTCHMFNLVAE